MLKGISIINAIFVIGLFIIFFTIIGFLSGKFPWFERKILDIWREFFGMPIPGTGLIYHFEEGSGDKVSDSSNHGNPGVLKDGNTGNTDGDEHAIWLAGDRVFLGSGSLSFDGTDDYIEVELNQDDINSTHSDIGITIEMAINPHTDPDCDGRNNWRYLLHKSYWDSYHLILEENLQITGRVNTVNGLCTTRTQKRLENDRWHHVAFVYSNFTGAKIFINGFEEARVDCTGIVVWSSGPLKIGDYNGDCQDGGGSPPVIMDEVRVYTRALSPEEIVMHYQGIF